MPVPPSPEHPAPRPGPGVPIVLAGAVVAAFVYVWGVGLDLSVRPPLPARIQADDVTGLVSLVGDLTARLAALAALGALAGVVGFTPKHPDHTLTADGRRLLAWAGRAGQIWFAASVLNTFANPAYVNGVPIALTLTPTSWWTFLGASPSALAWLASALAAAVVVGVAYVSRWYAASVLALAAGVLALTFVAVTGNVSVGLHHDWATDAAIAATVTLVPLVTAAVGVTLRSGEPDAAARLRRYHRLVPLLLVTAAASHAVMAWQQLAGQSVWTQAYGVPVIGFFTVFALVAFSWVVRQVTGEAAASVSRVRWSVARDVVLFVAWAAFATAENHIPPPRFLEPQTISTNYLGYEVAVAPTIERLISLGRPNLLWVLVAAFAVGSYAVGVIRVHRAGGRWPVTRALAWLAGWALTLFLAVTGLWEYSTVTYSWHMVVHMTVNMMVPVLCVLGGPFALIRAASRDAETHVPLGGVVEAVEAYRPWQMMTSPPVTWVAYVGGLFAVYFTPLFPWLMRYHWAHQLMLLFFMATGYFFFDLIIGYDERSRQLPHLVKLALVISIMPFHAVFAVGILSSRSLIGADFYQTLSVPWMTDLMADQNIAGQATWFLGEVPLFLVMIALAAQWFRQDSTDAARIDQGHDSGEDTSFDAYNDMLAELARRDAATQREATVKRLQR